MKANRFSTAMVLAIIALIFFACSNSSPNGPGDSSDINNNPSSSSSPNNPGVSSDSNNNPSSSSNGATGSNTQVYFVSEEAKQCSNSDISCINNALNVPFTGSGVIKDKDTVKIGTINNGEINLESFTPKEEFLDEDGQYCPNLMFYNNAGEFAGFLRLMKYEYENKDKYTDYEAHYCYFSKDYKKEETDTYDNGGGSQLLTWVYDYDVKKGWNLIYRKIDVDDRGDKEFVVFTYTNKPSILDGVELKWLLWDKVFLEEEESE
jgi:hypothetical protein